MYLVITHREYIKTGKKKITAQNSNDSEVVTAYGVYFRV